MTKYPEYKRFIHQLVESRENRTFLNSDEDHALDVLVEIFQLAQKKIRIFAGCLCRHVGNQPEYIVALSEFIERGGELEILLNAFEEESARTSNLYKRLAYYKSEGKPIIIKQTAAKPYLSNDPDKKEVHFTIGDDMAYRIETDINKRTAECNFNNPIVAKITADFFDSLFLDAVEVDVVKLFDHGNR